MDRGQTPHWYAECVRHFPTRLLIEPAIRYSARPARVAGRGGRSFCQYNLAYAVEQGEDYDTTIAHEIAHSVADQLYHGDWHGTLWKYIFYRLLAFPESRYHTYGYPSARSGEIAKCLMQLASLTEAPDSERELDEADVGESAK